MGEPTCERATEPGRRRGERGLRRLWKVSDFGPHRTTGLDALHIHLCAVLAHLGTRGNVATALQDGCIRDGRGADAWRVAEERPIVMIPHEATDRVAIRRRKWVIREKRQGNCARDGKDAQLPHHLRTAKEPSGTGAAEFQHHGDGHTKEVRPNLGTTLGGHRRIKEARSEPTPCSRRVLVCEGHGKRDWCQR